MSLTTLTVQGWKLRDSSRWLQDRSWWNRILVSVDADLSALTTNEYGFDFTFLEECYEHSASPMSLFSSRVLKYAMDTTERVVDLLSALGYRGKFSQKWYKMVDAHYAILFMTDCWSQSLKYHTSWLFAHFEDQAYPVRGPSVVAIDGFLCPGRQYNFLRRCLSRDDRQGEESRLTVLQGFKKSLLPLDYREVARTLSSHRLALGTRSETDPTLLVECRRVGRELRERTCKYRVAQNTGYSAHACIENSRSKGGFAGLAWERHGYRGVGKDDYCVAALHFPQLVGCATEGLKYMFLYTRFYITYQDLYEEMRPLLRDAIRSGCLPQAEVRIIPEPFKYRVISLGEEEVYATLRPLQQQMWSTLQRFDCFQLTGAGNADISTYVSWWITKYSRPGFRTFLSGDYKAATDNLHTDCMLAVAEEWFADDESALTVIKEVLAQAEILYTTKTTSVVEGLPVWDGAKERIVNLYPRELPESVVMENGQLMGNPLSFPLLCAINAALCRRACELDQNEVFDLENCPILINGDDCGLIGTENLYGTWASMACDVGLTPSVGKTYVSEDFFMINSQYFKIGTVSPSVASASSGYAPWAYDNLFPMELMNPLRGNCSYLKYQVGYTNLGILCGRKKGNHEDCEVKPDDPTFDEELYKFTTSVDANYQMLHLGVKKLPDLFGTYVENFRKFFDKVPIPFGIPIEEGGIGLPGKPGLEYNRTAIIRTFIQKDPSFVLGAAYNGSIGNNPFQSEDHSGYCDYLQEVGKKLRRVRAGCLFKRPKADWQINIVH